MSDREDVKKELNDRQKAFVREYVRTWNATKAAIKAGYAEDSAGVTGCNLLKNPNIENAISIARTKTAELAGVSALMIAEELMKVAFSDMGNHAEWGPNGVMLKPSSDMDTAAVQEVNETASEKGVRRSIKLHSKTDALDKLAKHLGFYAPTKVEHSGKIIAAQMSDEELAAIAAQGDGEEGS